MQEGVEVTAALDGKLLSDVQNEDWILLMSELKMARTKVSNSYLEVMQISTSLLEELSKATASSK